MPIGAQLKRLGKHSAIYGLGGLVSRIIAVLLLPLYTRYLSPSDYGTVETLIALTTVIGIVLRMGITSAFFRFYFDSPEPEKRRVVLRTSFWFTMSMATIGMLAGIALSPGIAELLFGSTSDSELVAASFVGLWCGMNYEQLTSLFRVEERSVAFVSASIVNILITIGTTLLLVVALEKGPLGVIVGNFTGTLVVYLVLLGYRREQLGLQFDRGLLREMNRFGLPLVPTALFLWTTNFSDRLFLVKLADAGEVGLYSLGVRLASAMVLLLTAFRLAWPAFAYSIEDEREAKRTYAYTLTYLVLLTTWVATFLALLSPWIVDWLAAPAFASSSRVVGPLAFAAVAFGGYIVVAIGVGRARRTQFNWVVTGAAAAVNVVLNLILIPPYGMMGAAVATIAAYSTMFVGMSWWSQKIYPVPYQWRRVLTAALAGVALAVTGKLVGGGFAVALALALAYPLALLPLGFYLPAERRAIGARLTAGTAVRTTRGWRARRIVWRIRRSTPRVARPLSRVLPDPGPPTKPILVVGCPRSGTSVLLQALLHSSELRSVQSEGHILWDEFHHPRDGGWDSDALSAADVSERERRYIHRAIRLVVRGKRFVDKTPENCLRIPYLDALFPDATFVFLRRRGADNVSSLMDAWRARPRFVKYRLPEPLTGLGSLSGSQWSFALVPGWRDLRNASLEEICARQYVACNEAVLAARRRMRDERWVDVGYEDLVANPTAELGKLFGSLGVPFTPAAERYAAGLRRNVSRTSLTAPAAEKWRGQNRKEIEHVLPELAGVEAQLGYTS